jgi:hypothetical protein
MERSPLSVEQRLAILREAIKSPRFEMDADKIVKLLDETLELIQRLREAAAPDLGVCGNGHTLQHND